MSALPTFEGFPKIPRLRRDIVITEKIDGTNALVYVTEEGAVHAGSRSRWITPEHDNFGFAAWVRDHESELAQLGPGKHFGEWWGAGIQRRYGLTEKRFSLFNTARFGDGRMPRPACCGVVPLLATGTMGDSAVTHALELLRMFGSVAAPGFMTPEGIVVFHTASSRMYKVTLEGDEKPKAAA